MNKRLLTGLIAAPFTPMHEDGSLNLQVIGPYAEFLMQKEICDGSVYLWHDGESVSLTTEERKAVAEKWMEAAKGKLKVIVHVGGMSQVQCAELAAHAQAIGADMIGSHGALLFQARFCR